MINQFKIGELVKYQKRKIGSTTASEDSAEADYTNDKLMPNKYIQSQKEMEIH